MEAPLAPGCSLEALVAPRLKKDGLMPVYLQISEAIRYVLRDLLLPAGTAFPPERVLPARLFPNLERYDLASQSLYKVLEENYKIQLGWSNQEVSAALPNKLQRKLLGINTPVALLVVKRMSYTTGDVPVELAVTTYRGDIYTAAVHAKRVR